MTQRRLCLLREPGTDIILSLPGIDQKNSILDVHQLPPKPPKVVIELRDPAFVTIPYLLPAGGTTPGTPTGSRAWNFLWRQNSLPRYVPCSLENVTHPVCHPPLRATLLQTISLIDCPHIDLSFRFQASDCELNSSINLLVLGSRRCGKTSFIRNALGRDRSPSSTQVAIKDRIYKIQLIELLFDDVDFSSERRIEWPVHVDGVPFPDIDGVFCLYDVSDKESVADVPPALSRYNPNPLQACFHRLQTGLGSTGTTVESLLTNLPKLP